MDTKIISLLVCKDFTNEQFDIFISKNDIDINQNIIHFGVLAYSQFLQYAQNKHHQDFDKNIRDELQLQYDIQLQQKHQENILLNNDCNTFKQQIQILQNTIHSLKNDTFFEINSLIDKGKQITKQEYQTIFDLFNIFFNSIFIFLKIIFNILYLSSLISELYLIQKIIQKKAKKWR
jgi:hypothetical protein